MQQWKIRLGAPVKPRAAANVAPPQATFKKNLAAAARARARSTVAEELPKAAMEGFKSGALKRVESRQQAN